MNSIFHRVSIRKYEDRPVEREKLMDILRAGMQAPSAGNQQPWEFCVVRDKAVLAQLAQVSPYAGPVGKAPVAIVTAYWEDCIFPECAEIDMAISMENMWLMTDALGLGGVMLGVAPLEDRMMKVEAILHLPKGLHAFAIFALGYPAEERQQQDRFDEGRIHWVE